MTYHKVVPVRVVRLPFRWRQSPRIAVKLLLVCHSGCVFISLLFLFAFIYDQLFPLFLCFVSFQLILSSFTSVIFYASCLAKCIFYLFGLIHIFCYWLKMFLLYEWLLMTYRCGSCNKVWTIFQELMLGTLALKWKVDGNPSVYILGFTFVYIVCFKLSLHLNCLHFVVSTHFKYSNSC